MYPFESIFVNGRDVRMSDILRDAAEANDEFERHTFTFIREWFGGNQYFELRTSGSTGTPKRIMITRDQMIASALATQQALKLQKGFTALVCVDTRYIAGQMMLARSFVTGMKVYAITPTNNPFSDLSDIRFDFCAMVPYQVSSILNSEKASSLNALGVLIIGGASVPEDVIAGLQHVDCSAYATYGMTETITHIALRALNGPGKSDHYSTLPGITIETDSRSCLIIRCPYLEHEVTTNDIVHILNPTSFNWIGRADNVINSGGVKVSPEDLELRVGPLIRSLNLHERFVISSLSDNQFGNRIILVIETQSTDDQRQKKLIMRLRDHLSRYEVPKEIYTLPQFPETGSGKIDRAAIRDLISKQQ